MLPFREAKGQRPQKKKLPSGEKKKKRLSLSKNHAVSPKTSSIAVWKGGGQKRAVKKKSTAPGLKGGEKEGKGGCKGAIIPRRGGGGV